METRKIKFLVPALLDWFGENARDLPWRRTSDPYGIWVSEIMLQQTQVKTVIPFWNRWMTELPTIKAAANASSARLHKLWEGLGYYTRVRNLQHAAQVIAEQHGGKFPEQLDAVLALPGIGRYTAGAICSIAFNQPVPILDGNVIRVLTRIFGIAENPKEKATNARLWQLASKLVEHAKNQKTPELKNLASFAPLRKESSCSYLNQSLMELGALVCTPRNPQCPGCPVKNLCVAFKKNRVAELPNLGKGTKATPRHYLAFVLESNGKFLVRQRPAGVVNAQLWEFPNREVNDHQAGAGAVFKSEFGFEAPKLSQLCTVKHSITRYRITLAAFAGTLEKAPRHATSLTGVWKTPAQMRTVAFTAAHKRLASAAAKSILSGR